MPREKTKFKPDPAARRFWGVILLIATVFVALSVFSYDWRDVSVLRMPPNDPACNLIGPLGARIAFLLFVLLGVGAYAVPLFTAVAGLSVLRDLEHRAWPRLLWLLLAVLAVPLVINLRPGLWTDMCIDLNIADAGGLLGYLITESLLVRWLSPVGAGLLVWSLLGVALFMAIGSEGFKWLAGLAMRGSAGVKSAIDRVVQAQRTRRKAAEEAAARDISVRAEKPARPTRPPKPAKPAKPPKPPQKSAPPKKEKQEDVIVPTPPAEHGEYVLPPISLLPERTAGGPGISEADSQRAAQILEGTLSDFGIEAQVTNYETGPVVTRYEVLPAPGIRVERIAALQNNLALSLKAHSIRVQAPIPGKGVVGVEIPNPSSEIVYLRQILESGKWKKKIQLPLALGKDVGGADVVADLAKMPHMLIAGATGSGKTVCMNSILAGLLMSRTPDELKLMLVDPKIVEFSGYNHLPHLVIPVVTDPKKVALALRWAIEEMERRYKIFAKVNVRNIESFNKRVVATQTDMFDAAANTPDKSAGIPDKVPYIVIVIDELADLMLAAGAEIENSIARLAQLSRAVGIHMIIATQRPSVNVITGTIKANFPARIAFQVAQKVDSRTILDTAGAETLLGRGDMLFLPPSTGKLVRGQGALVEDDEVQNIVEFIKKQAQPSYEVTIQKKMEAPASQVDVDADDDLLPQAVEIIRETRRASTSSLQRRLRIGYNRAGRLMDVLEQKGIVGPPRGSDPREILIDLDGEIPNNADAEDLGAVSDNPEADDEQP